MKTHVLLALVGLVTGFVVPAFTQEKEEVHPFLFGAIQAKPEIVQQLEAINKKFDEVFNKHDATAVAAFYSANAILSSPLGVVSGRPAIEEYYTDVFQRFSPSDRFTKISYVYAFGDDLCAIGGWTLIINGPHPPPHPAGGYLLNLYTRVVDTWKIRTAVLKYSTGQ
jgi:ketosteroid isomerase-like protein